MMGVVHSLYVQQGGALGYVVQLPQSSFFAFNAGSAPKKDLQPKTLGSS